jgi:hypothetical protein
MTSIQQSNAPFQGKTGPAAVSVTVRRTATMNFATTTSENDYQDTEFEKSVRFSHTVVALQN